MATPDQRSAGKTFCMFRWLIRLPEVARRSPAMTTPSANRAATTVVPWVTSTASDGEPLSEVPS